MDTIESLQGFVGDRRRARNGRSLGNAVSA